MLINVLKSKIHRAVVTDADLGYEGSITIDAALLERAGILPYEQVQVVNLNNGARFETYVIEGEAGSGRIALNGGAARMGLPGDLVIIMSYGMLPEKEAFGYSPRVVRVDSKNRPINGG